MGLCPERRRCGGNIAVGANPRSMSINGYDPRSGGWMGNTLVMPVVVRGLSVGYACYPWVTPIGFTHGCVLITALRFGLPMRTEGPARS